LSTRADPGMTEESTTPVQIRQRDPRLDFFRGLALWFIFVDHIPSNIVNWLTLRNFGFSDATEIFIFISGYSAAIAYSGTMRHQGFYFAAARVLHRCWQLYIAHIFLFVIFTAQIAYVAAHFSNPMYVEEMNVTLFVTEPHVALIEALLLRFRPANMDVLPLYIVLLLAFPVVLWAMQRRPLVVLGASAVLYVAARLLHWNLQAYPPSEVWFFNPFTWQLLFVLGALCGGAPATMMPLCRWRPWLAAFAAGYLAASFCVVMTWHIPRLDDAVPNWLNRVLYPIDKTNLDVLRLVHFLALAYIATRFVRPDARFLGWRWLRPVLMCGRHSLYVFCFGIYLSFAAYVVLSHVNGSIAMQVATSVAGIVAMTGLAYLLSWYAAKQAVHKNPAPAPTGPADREEKKS
jgi:hypothetical protein